MMHINFITKKKISFDINALKQIRLNNLTIIIVVGSLLFIMLAFGIVQKLRLDSIQSKRRNQQQQITRMRTELAQKGIQTSSWEGKWNLLKKFQNRVDWSDIIVEIVNAIPSNIWVNKIHAIDEKKNKLELSGKAPNQAAVANLMKSIEKIKAFSKVKLVSSTASTKDSSGEVTFVVNVMVRNI